MPLSLTYLISSLNSSTEVGITIVVDGVKHQATNSNRCWHYRVQRHIKPSYPARLMKKISTLSECHLPRMNVYKIPFIITPFPERTTVWPSRYLNESAERSHLDTIDYIGKKTAKIKINGHSLCTAFSRYVWFVFHFVTIWLFSDP